MNQSGDAAEQTVRMSLEGVEFVLKRTGKAAKSIAVFLYTLSKDKRKTSGKTSLTNMLKSGKELKVFSIRQDQLKKFCDEAKRYGVLYYALVNKKTKAHDGVVDILVKAEDAAKINRIVERFNLSTYDSATIRNDIAKARKAKEHDKGYQTKDKDVRVKEEDNLSHIKKEGKSVNPSLAKTEKDPLSEPTYKKNNYSKKGSIDKKSVKEKLDNYKKIIKDKDKSKQITPKAKTNNKVSKNNRAR